VGLFRSRLALIQVFEFSNNLRSYTDRHNRCSLGEHPDYYDERIHHKVSWWPEDKGVPINNPAQLTCVNARARMSALGCDSSAASGTVWEQLKTTQKKCPRSKCAGQTKSEVMTPATIARVARVINAHPNTVRTLTHRVRFTSKSGH
jgi:hypothetical protein